MPVIILLFSVLYLAWRLVRGPDTAGFLKGIFGRHLLGLFFFEEHLNNPTFLPLPVVIASPDVSMAAAVLAIAIPGAIQLTIGNIIEPKVMGESLDLHPVAILLNLIIWGMLWGIVGMLLSTPILAVMKILFEKFEGTRPLAALLAGRIGDLRA